MFGDEARLPLEILETVPSGARTPTDFAGQQYGLLEQAFTAARKHQQQSFRASKDRYDLGACAVVFRPGDQVYMRAPPVARPHKLSPRWKGPFTVLETRGPVVCVQETGRADEPGRWVHHNKLSRPRGTRLSANQNNIKNAQGHVQNVHAHARKDINSCTYACTNTDTLNKGIIAPDTQSGAVNARLVSVQPQNHEIVQSVDTPEQYARACNLADTGIKHVIPPVCARVHENTHIIPETATENTSLFSNLIFNSSSFIKRGDYILDQVCFNSNYVFDFEDAGDILMLPAGDHKKPAPVPVAATG
jgi:hypothetical protein